MADDPTILARYRAAENLTQSTMADLMGHSHRQYQNKEPGHAKMRACDWLALAALCKGIVTVEGAKKVIELHCRDREAMILRRGKA